MTALERQRLVAHLEMSGDWLRGEVESLSEAQLQFRPSEEAWNILEVVDHLVVSEAIYWQDFQDAMKAPPSGERPQGTDIDMLWYGIDRTRRQQALTAEMPQGKIKTIQAGLEAYGELRARILEYTRTTQEDLRSHVVERERCDAYQWLLLISAHAQRHVLQIREIKNDPGFPEK